MKTEKYHLKSDTTFTYFEFISVGANGSVRKMIEFQNMLQPNLFNLAFGDENRNTSEMDDLAVTNNGDTQKVLATVVAALYIFFDRNPNAIVYAAGSTPARTRLYRIGINKFYDEIQSDFYLYGRIGEKLYTFETGVDYEGFVAQRKFE